jgi:hypothetical protein
MEAGQEEMKTTVTFVLSELEETIKDRVETECVD